MPTKALVAYSMSSTFVQTTLDYLKAFKRYSGFEVSYVHVTHNAEMGFDFSTFDVVFHSYCARLCFDGYVSASYREAMRKFRGVKVLAVQDEYDRTDTLKAAIKDLDFDIVLTCVLQDSLEYVYPRAEFPNVRFLTVFTGYVPEESVTRERAIKPLDDRSFFLGYRGRDIGGRYGRLGFDKFEIGRRMKEICDQREIVTDIAMDENSRIYGEAWFDFVGDCRAMLGSESGSNVFDFDGSIEKTFKAMTEKNGGAPPSYKQFLPIVAEQDGKIEMGQISPRIFECALMRTPMVLFEGRYSDAIEAEEHYIPLKKDFSNVDAVLERINDGAAISQMAARAYDHLVASQRFGYAAFYQRVSGAISEQMKKKGNIRRLTATSENLEVLEPWKSTIETPTEEPSDSRIFDMRIAFHDSEIYGGETERLKSVFSYQQVVCLQELDRLQAVYEAERSRFAATSPALAEIANNFGPIERSVALTELLSSLKEEESEAESRHGELKAGIKLSWQQMSTAAFLMVRDFEMEQIAHYNHNLATFNGVYAEEVQIMNEKINKLYNALLKQASSEPHMTKQILTINKKIIVFNTVSGARNFSKTAKEFLIIKTKEIFLPYLTRSPRLMNFINSSARKFRKRHLPD